MRPQDALNAIKPHEYGLKAAAACNPIIDRLLTSTDNKSLIASIQFAKDNFKHQDIQDRAMAAVIHFASTNDRDAAEQIIKSYEYVAANLHLGKHMHILTKRQEKAQEIDYPRAANNVPQTIEHQVQPADDYDLAFTSELEILFETSMPSHAPDAAAKTRLQSVIY